MMNLQLQRWLIVGLLLLASISGLRAQICTPDTQYTESGLYPEVLPAGTVGEPYQAVATAVLPHEFDVGIGVFEICKGRILDTQPNLADYGLSYECNLPDCVIEIDHTTDDSVTYACLVISGTPTQPLDSVEVVLQAVVGNVSNGVCDSTQTFPESLRVALPITTATSVQGSLARAGYTLHAFQPSPDQLRVNYTLAQPGPVSLRLIDMQGRELYHQRLRQPSAGNHTVTLPLSSSPAGVYLLRLSEPGTADAITRRVMIVR